MIVEMLWRALHKNHNFQARILSYFSSFDHHFYSISCLLRAILCHPKEEWLEIWYAYLLQYSIVQCLTTMCCLYYFPLNVIFTAFSACPEYNCHLKSERLQTWNACLLQYYAVQCTRTITLPSAKKSLHVCLASLNPYNCDQSEKRKKKKFRNKAQFLEGWFIISCLYVLIQYN